MQNLFAFLSQNPDVKSGFVQFIESMNLDLWDWVACGAGLLSVIVGILTAYFQFQTEGNTKKMSSSIQVSRLKGFYRHMYRNMVKIRAIQILIEREHNKGTRRVPSAEHLLKLKLDENDICEEAFYDNTKVFEKLKELKLQVRNVNIEVDVADRYLGSPEASYEARKQILDTLFFKQGQIAEEIETILNENFGEKNVCEHVKEVIVASYERSKDVPEDKRGKLTDDEQFSGHPKMMVLFENAKYKKEEYSDFLKIFNEDVAIELGINNSGDLRIAMV